MAIANGNCIKKYQLLATGLQILETMIKDLPFNCKQNIPLDIQTHNCFCKQNIPHYL